MKPRTEWTITRNAFIAIDAASVAGAWFALNEDQQQVLRTLCPDLYAALDNLAEPVSRWS